MGNRNKGLNILYYNKQLGCYDGSSMHAKGLLKALQDREDLSVEYCKFTRMVTPVYNAGSQRLIEKLKKPLTILRIFRKLMHAYNDYYAIKAHVNKNGFKPDIILARLDLYDITPIRLAQFYKCILLIEDNTPFVYECCQIKKSNFRVFVRNFEKIVFKNADGVYVVSEILKRMILKDYSDYITKDQIKVVGNGYMKELYEADQPTISQTRNKIRDQRTCCSKFIVTFLGSLRIWHGIDKLIDLASSLTEEKEIEFWVIGDGECRGIVKTYITKNNNLKWFGNLSPEDMRDHLWASDLGIMPYRNMKFFYYSPLKMYDMIGAGLPFISVDYGQIKEVCTEGLNDSFLIKPDTIDQYKSRIIRIKEDKEIYKEMVAKIIDIKEKYHWNARAEELISWIKSGVIDE